MSKKQEFMNYINEMLNYDNPSKTMIRFLIETLEISLTEERVKSKEFLEKMIRLTDKYIAKEK